MQTVYVLQHVHTIDEDTEDIKMIGVYSTEVLAQSALTRVSSQPGFREAVDGFSIDAYPIDKDHWTEGYISWSDAQDENISKPGLQAHD